MYEFYEQSLEQQFREEIWYDQERFALDISKKFTEQKVPSTISTLSQSFFNFDFISESNYNTSHFNEAYLISQDSNMENFVDVNTNLTNKQQLSKLSK